MENFFVPRNESQQDVVPCARPTSEGFVLSVPARETVAALWLHILPAFERNHTETPGICVVMVTLPNQQDGNI